MASKLYRLVYPQRCDESIHCTPDSVVGSKIEGSNFTSKKYMDSRHKMAGIGLNFIFVFIEVISMCVCVPL